MSHPSAPRLLSLLPLLLLNAPLGPLLLHSLAALILLLNTLTPGGIRTHDSLLRRQFLYHWVTGAFLSFFLLFLTTLSAFSSPVSPTLRVRAVGSRFYGLYHAILLFLPDLLLAYLSPLRCLGHFYFLFLPTASPSLSYRNPSSPSPVTFFALISFGFFSLLPLPRLLLPP